MIKVICLYSVTCKVVNCVHKYPHEPIIVDESTASNCVNTHKKCKRFIETSVLDLPSQYVQCIKLEDLR